MRLFKDITQASGRDQNGTLLKIFREDYICIQIELSMEGRRDRITYGPLSKWHIDIDMNRYIRYYLIGLFIHVSTIVLVIRFESLQDPTGMLTLGYFIAWILFVGSFNAYRMQMRYRFLINVFVFLPTIYILSVLTIDRSA
ncbi:MAG: hypothetical protein ACW98K_00675 [Candidatus Kariarchaeaceae archaeon]